MSELKQVAQELADEVESGTVSDLSPASRRFIERVTFADADAILDMLRDSIERDLMALPVWARNLAYRLAVLQRPNDQALLREAAVDLLYWGPDWDEVAAALQQRADEVSGTD
jgi:hypothetical protein